jgi:glyceraldehyde 3-phosphate dehydrogenase
MDGMSMRAPVPDGSVVDLVAILGKEVTRDELNAAFARHADTGAMQGVLKYMEDPIVSIDIVGDPYSSIFDSQATMVQGNMVKLLSWYDNEWGYSNRVVDLCQRVL